MSRFLRPTLAVLLLVVAAPAFAAQTPGAVVLDSTWYDLQDMASLGTRVIVHPDGRVYAGWEDDFCALGGGCPPNLSAPQPHPNRGMAFVERTAGGVWGTAVKVGDPRIRNCCVTDLAGGFGSIAVDGQGRAIVAQHMNEEGCDLRGNFWLKDGSGPSGFKAFLTPIRSPSFLFPQVVATAGGGYTVLGEVPRGGVYDETEEFRTSHVANAAATFVCPVGWQGGEWTAFANPALFKDGRAAFPSMAAASDGRVGVAVTDFGGDVFLFESSNGTFAPGTVTTRRLTSYTDAAITAPDSTSNQYRPWINCHVAYADTTPHVVWSELQARRVGGNITFADWRSRIVHWDPVRGVEEVHRVPAGVADRFDDVDRGLSGPLAGFNTISVDWPQVGFSPNGGEAIVAWIRYADSEVDPTANMQLPGIVTGVGRGDVAASVRVGAGAWSAAQNLTQTPDVDERFVSLATRNPDGKAHVLYQAGIGPEAGVTVIGDRGTTPGNVLRAIVYLERTLTASVVDVPSSPVADPTNSLGLRLAPNPARGSIRFTAQGAASSDDAVEIVAVDGRRLARLPWSGTDGEVVTWNGRTDGGTTATSGLYFARRAGSNAAAVRFLWLPH